MPVWRRLSRIALVCITLCPLPAVAAAPSDQAAAERVMGPQWKHLACRAGLIFTGTVLRSVIGSGLHLTQAATSSDARSDAQSQLRLGGTFSSSASALIAESRESNPGQILTIHEWIGALSRQPALRSGERVLLFLYPPSRLGLTSPVGGAQGQIRLDSTGQNVAENALPVQSTSRAGPQGSRAADASEVRGRVPVSQLERAIRAARGKQR